MDLLSIVDMATMSGDPPSYGIDALSQLFPRLLTIGEREEDDDYRHDYYDTHRNVPVDLQPLHKLQQCLLSEQVPETVQKVVVINPDTPTGGGGG